MNGSGKFAVSSRQAADALRILAMDAGQAARVADPGRLIGMADIAEVLWLNFMQFDPAHPDWFNRDRFVLSTRHSAMLQYAVLHLCGFDLPIQELRRFHQLHSRTPGQLQHGLTPGVDASAGPPGQGLADAVGMAIAERLMAVEFNRPDHAIVDHWTYVFADEGCLMAGLSQEALSLAGTLGLDKLVAFYEDRSSAIDGETPARRCDDTAARFEAGGWRVIRDVDGQDAEAVYRAVVAARARQGQPVLVICKTALDPGSPDRAGQAQMHAAPPGGASAPLLRETLNWPQAPFSIPPEIYAHWDERERGAERYYEWESLLYGYERAYPKLAAEFKRRLLGELPTHWPQLADQALTQRRALGKPQSSGKSLEAVLDLCAQGVPELLGAPADSNESDRGLRSKTLMAKPGAESGHDLRRGVREFGLAAAMNGIALHGGLIPCCRAPTVLSDAMHNAIRMSALMRQRVIYALTHDPVTQSEDGPLHQPVEHAASLRMIPHLRVWRPCDAVETAVAWRCAIEHREGPSVLLLSRQPLAPLRRSAEQEAQIARGGYVISESSLPLEVVLIATGAEVWVARTAQTLLEEDGIGARVVSMPSTSVFDRQDISWRSRVLPPGLPRVAVEASNPDYWRKYVGLEGAVIGLEDFLASAPASQLMEYLGITAARVAEAARIRARSASIAGLGEGLFSSSKTQIVRSIN